MNVHSENRRNSVENKTIFPAPKPIVLPNSIEAIKLSLKGAKYIVPSIIHPLFSTKTPIIEPSSLKAMPLTFNGAKINRNENIEETSFADLLSEPESVSNVSAQLQSEIRKTVEDLDEFINIPESEWLTIIIGNQERKVPCYKSISTGQLVCGPKDIFPKQSDSERFKCSRLKTLCSQNNLRRFKINSKSGKITFDYNLILEFANVVEQEYKEFNENTIHTFTAAGSVKLPEYLPNLAINTYRLFSNGIVLGCVSDIYSSNGDTEEKSKRDRLEYYLASKGSPKYKLNI
jgi:hypothetical protein